MESPQGSSARTLAEVAPELCAEWDSALNGDLTPSDVSYGARTKAWWSHPCPRPGHHHRHVWSATLHARTRSDGSATGCPVCANRRVQPDCNSYAAQARENTRYAFTLTEWDAGINAAEGIHPDEVGPCSRKEAAWAHPCPLHENCLHRWRGSLKMRNHKTQAQGCPDCSHRGGRVGCTPLSVSHPRLAAQWHPSANGALTPADVAAGSDLEPWWRCDACENVWTARVSSRAIQNRGCSRCAKGGYDPSRPGWFYLLRRTLADGRRELQIGVSNVIDNRLRQHRLNGWDELLDLHGPCDGAEVWELEHTVKTFLRLEGLVLAGTSENWSEDRWAPTTVAQVATRAGAAELPAGA